jgi:hypothetical protein
MTIVVSGYALPRVDSYSAPAVYGLTLKAGQQPTVAVLAASSIDQWYAIDFKVKRRRPVTALEWKLLRQFIDIAQRAKRQYLADQRENRKLELLFEGALRGRPVRMTDRRLGIRLPALGDASGLRPMKRREMRGRP